MLNLELSGSTDLPSTSSVHSVYKGCREKVGHVCGMENGKVDPAGRRGVGEKGIVYLPREKIGMLTFLPAALLEQPS